MLHQYKHLTREQVAQICAVAQIANEAKQLAKKSDIYSAEEDVGRARDIVWNLARLVGTAPYRLLENQVDTIFENLEHDRPWE
jgi:hypothetical protein